MFPGTNRAHDLTSPVVMFAPGNSGSTTILQAGASAQPNTMVCLLRANSRPEVFIDTFTESIGLSVRSRGRVMSRFVECT